VVHGYFLYAFNFLVLRLRVTSLLFCVISLNSNDVKLQKPWLAYLAYVYASPQEDQIA
jgi:hypothetical protein